MEKVDPIQFFLLFLYYYCLVYPNHKKKNIFFFQTYPVYIIYLEAGI